MSAQPATIEELKARSKGPRADKISVRIATNQEGPQVHALVQQAGFEVEGIDWSRIAPFWLVALLDRKIVGCVQVCLSLPIGRVEMLAVDNSIPHITRALLVEQLVLSACATLKAGGAQMAAGLIPFEMKSYKRLLKRRGCVSLGVGNEMAKRL